MASNNETDCTERFQPCQECDELVDTQQPGVWKAPNDEQWWHEGCYDKLKAVEEIASKIRNIMIPESEFDGLSDEFHDRLDNAQAELETAVERERLKQEQNIGPYSLTSDSEQ